MPRWRDGTQRSTDASAPPGRWQYDVVSADNDPRRVVNIVLVAPVARGCLCWNWSLQRWVRNDTVFRSLRHDRIRQVSRDEAERILADNPGLHALRPMPGEDEAEAMLAEPGPDA